MPESPPLREPHPRGTLFIVGIYGLLFVLAWFGVYVWIYLRRGGVTP